MKNLLLAISGPSGVGKGTLVDLLLKNDDNLVSSVSCTTRAPRQGEVDGVNYFFLTKEQFKNKIAENGFLEYDEHFGHFYGTPQSFVEKMLEQKSVILEIDVKGAMNAKRRMQQTVTVFIAPPSKEALFSRLTGRSTESQEQIEQRLARCEYELSFAKEYDYTVVNDDLSQAYARLKEIIEYERNKA